jgi:hypothetical protein
MRLLIVASETLGETPPDTDGVSTLYQTPHLLIQGSADVQELRLGDGQRVLLAGEIEGLRTPSGDLRRVSWGLPEVSAVLSRRDFDALEGRYILIVIGDDGDCEVRTDRFGQMDLYYHESSGRTALASDLSLLSDSAVSSGYDQTAWAHALCVYGYRPAKQHTLYQGVRRLGVNQFVYIDEGRVEIKTGSFQPVQTGVYGDRELHEYSDLLLDAVQTRGSRNGNVVYLSSGWDSTSLLACLVHVFGASKVRAVIGRMRYAERSGVVNQFEVDRARAVADFFGVRLDIVELDYRERGPDLVEDLRQRFQSHQMASLAGLGQALLAAEVARTSGGDETIFAGEISDGAHNLGFSQFATIFHPVQDFREYSDKMASYLFGPTFLGLLKAGQHDEDPVYQLLRGRCGDAMFDEAVEGDEAGRTMQLLASFFLRGARMPLWSLRNSRFLTDGGRMSYASEMESTYLKRAARDVTADTLYAWYLHLYNSFHWQSSTVATMALTAEAEGLRLAMPFWDGRLQQFLSAMPESWGRGLDLNPTKYPLKWTLRNRIKYPLHLQVGPHSYLYDVDPSFNHSAEILYGSAFAPYFRDRLKQRQYQQVLAPDVFDLGYVDGVVSRYLEGAEVRGAELTDLMSLCTMSMVGWYGYD